MYDLLNTPSHKTIVRKLDDKLILVERYIIKENVESNISDNFLSFQLKYTGQYKDNDDRHQDMKVGEVKEFKDYETDGMTKTGRCVWYHKTGQVFKDINFIDTPKEKQHSSESLIGQEDGFVELFHNNGMPMERGHYDTGSRIGMWTFFDRTGNLYKTKTYFTEKDENGKSYIEKYYK